MRERDEKYDSLYKKVVFQDDEQAFKKLFLEFYPSLCVYTMRYIPNEESARDIVQDVFYKIWKNRKKIIVTSSFRNLLVTSVRNRCMDHLRKQEVVGRYVEKNSTPGHHVSPEEVYTLKELEATITGALQKLPPNIREAFEMNRYKGMTYIAIADKMGLSPKTIEAYISKALKILRVELRDYLPLSI